MSGFMSPQMTTSKLNLASPMKNTMRSGSKSNFKQRECNNCDTKITGLVLFDHMRSCNSPRGYKEEPK